MQPISSIGFSNLVAPDPKNGSGEIVYKMFARRSFNCKTAFINYYITIKFYRYCYAILMVSPVPCCLLCGAALLDSKAN